ncbi:TIGR04063 family PEP-CTERM/XrtA system glycosyltransferase [Nitrosospira multiformis]|uniref:Glycosyl transferase, group 1 n=1 Tax=Nitrosospira multiformis (strain ATCC 25196 / NCIMB 11849 / C 71) TaxID=323848 RepID=Q2YCC4_NITMU|nr:TIGR04063 family PEP-CTERM/XrtA system glycosyltransferase [Nitrosospira multiformis]ABB73597.1 Glycosyl transferase, group 1 [Nitrosospira multiformis ATCC 25196]SDZ77131.1 PEP-CTERM/exosortase A-associated glycosyltransferase, Daro_2409 family [Nitrosospira multiformis]SEF38850.1 PEP-CTERM/exosortase A-associated glycosyltransferase, Daro_2409 family [Nitrosospira multiformis ATCC 25196]
MRILHILDHSIPLHSGYTFRTLSILNEQRNLGWETFHLTGSKQENCSVLEECVEGWHFYRTPAPSGLRARLPVLNQLAVMEALTHRLTEVVKIVEPDILHAHSPVLNALPALRVGRRSGIPVVYEVRAFWEDAAVDHGTHREWGARYRLTRELESYALRHVDAVTTICEGLRGDILKRGIPSEKVTVIPNAVNLETFRMSERGDLQLANALGMEGKVLLGFIGSFYAYEGLTVLLNALPRMLAANPDIRILLVGGGPQEDELKSLTARRGLQGKVIFTGRVPHDQVRRYYNLIDILVYPRLPMRLTDLVTPLKPLEAMAQGRLVAASDVGGHLELIQDGKTGVLFKAGDSDALAARILNLISSTDTWDTLRAGARDFVETQRNWAGSVAGYKEIYRTLLSRKASS